MNKLAQYLADKKMSQEAFANSVGTTQATISRIKEGKMQPDIDLASRIQAQTEGHVDVASWPKFKAVAGALGGSPQKAAS